MTANPLKLAGCIVTDEQGGVLLLHRKTVGHQQWEIPGGKIENGEATAEAAKRELKEELGIDVEIKKLLGRKQFTEDAELMEYGWYEAKITSGNPKIMEPAIFDDMNYFSLPEMQQIMLSAGARSFLGILKNSHDS